MSTQETCMLTSCHRCAKELVDHPGRPEGVVPLCEDHAVNVLEDIEGAQVVEDG